MAESRAERTLNRLLNALPGYSGYRDKESRRDADRRVRDRLYADLTARVERIERVATKLADERRIGEVGQINAISSGLRHLSNRINTATYGYGGVFGDRDVNAAVLDQLRLFDESLFAGLEPIDSAIASLETAGDDARQRAAEAVAAATAALTARFEQRNQVIDSAVPATPEQMSNVLAVLQSPEERMAAETPPAAYEMHDRDALAVLGDNFVVDARIEIESAAGHFRLFRVDVGPDRWLLVPRRPGNPFALVAPTKESYVPGQPATIGTNAFTVTSTGTGTGEVIGAGGETGRRPVAYTLLAGESEPNARAVVLHWGAEQQVFAGSLVHPDDVEVFGKPS